MKKIGVLTVFFVFCMLAVCLSADYKLPPGMKGFSGMLRGKVVSKVKNGFVLKVEEVLKLWKGNKAKKPESVIGKKVLINPRWAKGDDGKWYLVKLHVNFIRKLEVGETIKIEVVNNEGHRLHILELSAEQRRLAAGKGDEREDDRKKDRDRDREEKKERKLPKKGVVVGEITQLRDLSFKLKVKDASKGCQVLEGETLNFIVRHVKRRGKWIPDTRQVKAFGQLRLGDTIRVEFYHDEHWRVKKLRIIERAGKERAEELRKKQHREEREREKEEKHEKERAREREKEKEKHAREREREKTDRREKEGREEREEREAGDRPRGWPKEGGLLGTVTGIGATTLSVKVIEASKGAGEMVGETVTFYANWVKNREGKWVPDPEQVELFHSVDLDDKVELRFYFQEHYRIRKLEKE